MAFLAALGPMLASIGSVAGAAAGAGTTIGTIGNVLAAAGSVAGVVGSLAQASQAQRAARDESAALGVIGAQNKAAMEKRGQYLMARNAATAAAGNVDPFSGSALEVDLENAFNLGKEKSYLDYETKLKQNRAIIQGQNAAAASMGGAVTGLSSLGSILGKGFQLSSTPTASPIGPRASSFDSWWGG